MTCSAAPITSDEFNKMIHGSSNEALFKDGYREIRLKLLKAAKKEQANLKNISLVLVNLFL